MRGVETGAEAARVMVKVEVEGEAEAGVEVEVKVEMDGETEVEAEARREGKGTASTEGGKEREEEREKEGDVAVAMETDKAVALESEDKVVEKETSEKEKVMREDTMEQGREQEKEKIGDRAALESTDGKEQCETAPADVDDRKRPAESGEGQNEAGSQPSKEADAEVEPSAQHQVGGDGGNGAGTAVDAQGEAPTPGSAEAAAEVPTVAPGPRGKVYVLNDCGRWDDRGTGHVVLDGHGVRVFRETDRLQLLDSVVRADTFYHLQGGTIISWTETISAHGDEASEVGPAGGDGQPGGAAKSADDARREAALAKKETVEMALSFAEPGGCRKVHEAILKVQAELNEGDSERSGGSTGAAVGGAAGIAAAAATSSAAIAADVGTQAGAGAGHALGGSSASGVVSAGAGSGAGASGAGLVGSAPVGGAETASGVGAGGGSGLSGAAASASLRISGGIMHVGSGLQNQTGLGGESAHLSALTATGSLFDDELDPTGGGGVNVNAWGGADPIDEAPFGHDGGTASMSPASGVMFLSSAVAAQHHMVVAAAAAAAAGGGGGSGAAAATEAAAAAAFSMPAPDRAGLEALATVLAENGPIHVAAVRERVIAEISAGDYIARLCDVFRQAEDLMDFDALRLLYFVFRSLFVLGSNTVVEILVNEKNIINVIGALEYEPEVLSEEAEAAAAAAAGQHESPDTFAGDQNSHEGRDGAMDGEVAEGEAVDSSGADDGVLRTAGADPAADVQDAVAAGSTEASAGAGKLQQDDHTMDVERQVSSDAEDEQRNVARAESEGASSPFGDSSRGIMRRHRNFLVREAEFKSVIEIPDETVMAKIHQNYRVSYIKDVILSRVLDDCVHNALSSLVFFNNVDIVMHFVSDRAPLEDLFAQFKSCLVSERAAGLVLASANDLARLETQRMALGGGDTSPLPNDNKKDQGSRVSTPFAQGGSGVSSRIARGDTGKLPAVADSSPTKEGDVAMSSEAQEGGMAQSKETNVEGIGQSSRTAQCVETETAAKALNSPRAAASPAKDTSSPRDVTGRLSEDVSGPGTEKLRGLLNFLNDLCSLAKAQQPLVRNKFHGVLRDLGVLEVALETLKHRDVSIRLLGSDVLSAAVMHDQCDIRLHMLRNLPSPAGHVEGTSQATSQGGLPGVTFASSDVGVAGSNPRPMGLRSSPVGGPVVGEKTVPRPVLRSQPLSTIVNPNASASESQKTPGSASAQSGGNGAASDDVVVRETISGSDSEGDVRMASGGIESAAGQEAAEGRSSKISGDTGSVRTEDPAAPTSSKEATCDAPPSKSAPVGSSTGGDSGLISSGPQARGIAPHPSEALSEGTGPDQASPAAHEGGDPPTPEIGRSNSAASTSEDNAETKADSPSSPGTAQTRRHPDAAPGGSPASAGTGVAATGDAKSVEGADGMVVAGDALAAATTTAVTPFQATSDLPPRLDVHTSNELFPLLAAMMDVLCNDSDSGVFLTVLEQLKSLLDTSTMRSTVERERFLDVFYDRFVGRLLGPLTLSRRDDMAVPLPQGTTVDDVKSMDCNTSYICDLLAFCVMNHSFRIKYFILGNDVVGKVLRLLRHRRPHVRLAALRFARACIGAQDDVYDRYFVKDKLLRPVFELFASNGHRDNLLNSAVLELVAFLSSNHRLLLLNDVMEHHSDVLQETTSYSTVFLDARKYLEGKANMATNPAVAFGNAGTASAGGDGGDPSGGAGANAVMSLDPHVSRFGTSIFGHQDIRIAPDQDEDDNYFASDDDGHDPGMNELSRIMDGGKIPVGSLGDQNLLASSSDGPHGLSSGVGGSGSGQLKGHGRDLLPIKRQQPGLRAIGGGGIGTHGPGGSLSGVGGSSAAHAGGHGLGPGPRSPTGMSVAFPLCDEADDEPAPFEDVVLSSSLSNRVSGGRGQSLMDYPFENEAPDDMFVTDSNNADAPSTGPGANRQSSSGVGGPTRGMAMSLRWEGGGYKETTRIVGGGSNSSGSSGGLVRVFDTGNSGSNGRSDGGGVGDEEAANSPGAGTGGSGSGDTVVACDSGDSDAPGSPKKRRREAPDAEGNLPGGGIEVSTKRMTSTSSTEVERRGSDASSRSNDAVVGVDAVSKRRKVSPNRSEVKSPEKDTPQ